MLKYHKRPKKKLNTSKNNIFFVFCLENHNIFFGFLLEYHNYVFLGEKRKKIEFFDVFKFFLGL